ncbi:MAG: hypothetical protein ABIJ21_08890 [Nanoarchaeota archaeon]
MRASLLDIREALGENSLDFKFLQEFVSSAILDPSEDVRRNAVRIINETHHGIIKRGFAVANKLFVVMDCENMPYLSYVCDIPRAQQYGEPKSFCI